MAEKKLWGDDEIITVNPLQCGGHPCIRNLRIRVTDILDLLGAGLSTEEVLKEHPDLSEADVYACIRYASQKINHPRIQGSNR